MLVLAQTLLLLARPASAAETTLTIAQVSGALDEEEVEPTLRRHALELSRCLARHLPESRSPTSLSLSLTLTAQRGGVRPGSVSLLAPPGAPGLSGCVVPKVYLWDFPFTLRATDIHLALVREAPPPAAPQAAPGSDIARLADELERQGRLVSLTPDLLAVLRGEDLCAQAADEFAAARCAETAPARAAAAEAALEDGWLHIRGLEARLGTWDAASERFPLIVDPVLIAGGLSTPDGPAMTVGRPEVRYDRDRSGGFELGLEPLSPLRSVPLPLDNAEALARSSGRRLVGEGLVRLRGAYAVPIRTAAWFEAQADPDGWRARLVAGEARDTDRFVTLYGLDVAPMAMGFTDPRTGEIVAEWLAPGLGTEAEDAAR